MCLGSGGGRTRLSDESAGEARDSRHLDILIEPQGVILQALHPPEGQRLSRRTHVRLFRRCQRSFRYLGESRVCLGYGSVPGSTLKRLCDALARLTGRSTNTPEGKKTLSGVEQ